MTGTGRESSSKGQPITPARIALWASPLALSLLVLALTFVMNWQPWFGYASVIAGALGSLMLAGEGLKIGG